MEPYEYTKPINSFEVFTFDLLTNSLKKSHIFSPADKKHNFPKLFVCKIYSDISCFGTGFVFRAPSGQALIITALHVQKNIFLAPSKFFACFEYKHFDTNYKQQFYKIRTNSHTCITGNLKLFLLISLHSSACARRILAYAPCT